MTDRTDGSTGEYPTGESGDQPVSPPAGPPTPPVPYGTPAPHGVAAPYAVGPVAPRTNTLAIVSLVTGFCCSIAAVVTGHIALGQIKRTGEQGRGLALAGTIVSGVSVLVGVIFIIFYVLLIAGAIGTASSYNYDY